MNKRHLELFAVVIISFILAFVSAWALFSRGNGNSETPPAIPARTLTEADLHPFLQAVAAEDFAAMDRLGGELFAPGNLIPDSQVRLEEYATTSFAPHLVYAFFTRIETDRTYRVLLTTDEEDRVVSFMAEEMAITK